VGGEGILIGNQKQLLEKLSEKKCKGHIQRVYSKQVRENSFRVWDDFGDISMEVKRGKCGWTVIGRGWRGTSEGSHVDCMVLDGLY